MRVSAHSRRLNTIGEFADTAMSGAASSCARLYIRANSSGPTCRCAWKLELHASIITES